MSPVAGSPMDLDDRRQSPLVSPPGDFAATRRTKLICTIGPATADRIERSPAAGMDVARINFSHGTPASHAAAARAVPSRRGCRPPTARDPDRPRGPEDPLGRPGRWLRRSRGRPAVHASSRRREGRARRRVLGQRFVPADGRRRPVGDPIFLADGAAELRVTGVDDGVRTEVVRGGTIRSRAGVAIPAARLSSPALTAKDRADIPRAIAIGATYIGLSFVRERRRRRRASPAARARTVRRSSPRSRRARQSSRSTPSSTSPTP